MEDFIVISFIVAGIAAACAMYVYFTTDKEKKPHS